MNEQQIVAEFNRLFYIREGQKGFELTWMGRPMNKCVTDVWAMQEIVCLKKPDWFIECGTGNGGFTLFMANIFDIIGNGHIITVDKRVLGPPLVHPRITRFVGSDISKKIFDRILKVIKGKGSIMVDLDSNHSEKHVLKQLELYAPLVSKNQYLVIEDTNIVGPSEAILAYMKDHSDGWESHRYWDTKFMLTYNPCGYIFRTK
jgi:cephalosporin hydroxylase